MNQILKETKSKLGPSETVKRNQLRKIRKLVKMGTGSTIYTLYIYLQAKHEITERSSHTHEYWHLLRIQPTRHVLNVKTDMRTDWTPKTNRDETDGGTQSEHWGF